jgi:dynein heavy chain, axonemal
MYLLFRLLYEKREELSSAANKLKNGLFKIDETREKVQVMSGELEEARTKVTQFQKQCEEFLVIIVQQKRDADEQQKVTIVTISLVTASTIKW